MKKLSKILFFTIFLIFSSCSKDDNSSSSTSTSIVGVWDETYIVMIENQGYYLNYPNDKVYTEQDTTEMIIGTDLINRQWTFESNNDWSLTGSSLFGPMSLSGTWQQNGDNITINFIDDLDPYYGAEVMFLTINSVSATAANLTFIDSDTTNTYDSVGALIVEFYEDISTYDLEKN